MSKIGKLPITLPSGVTAIITDGKVTVTGPKGTLAFGLPEGITATVTEDVLQVAQVDATRETTKNLFGLTRAMLANMVKGVSTGVEKKLELSGVGYRATAAGTELTLHVGFSHPVKISAPAGVTFTVAENIITVAGIDKAMVGLIAARVHEVKPPEPYKGKGIKYVDEYIRKKAGKSAKAVGAK